MALPLVAIAAAIGRLGVTQAAKKYGKKAVQQAVAASTKAKSAGTKAKSVGRGAAARVKAAENKLSGAAGSKKPIQSAKANAKPTDKRVKGVRGKSKAATTRRSNANRASNAEAMRSARAANIRSGRKRIATGATVASVAIPAGVAAVKGTKAKAPKRSKFGVGSAKTITHNGRKMANVDASQLKATGMSLRSYMNAWNKTGKRPTKAAVKPKKARTTSPRRGKPGQKPQS